MLVLLKYFGALPIGWSSLRYFRKTKEGHSQLATVELTNFEENKVVTLIGVSHIAEIDFYEGIKRDLEFHQLAGGELQMEYMKTDKKSNKKQPYSDLADLVDLVPQMVYLNPDNFSHVHADMTMDGFLKMLPKRKEFVSKINTLNNLQLDSWNTRERKIARVFLRWFIRNMGYIPSFDRLGTGNMRVILFERNNLATQNILDSKSHNIVAVWGAAHLSGIVRRLKRKGYKITDVRYRTNVKKTKH